MLLNSSEYMALFFPCVVVGCIVLRRFAGPKAAQVWILIASVVFYGWWKPSHLPYLLGSILVNQVLVGAVGNAGQPLRKRLLQLGLFLNVGYLCLFKYVNFLLSNLSFVVPKGFHFVDLEFPLGISFFTLTQIMYLVDVYESLLPPMKLFDYATFISFFPYVISGPIPKAKRMLHQIGDFGGKDGAFSVMFTRGAFLFTIGLAKKVLFADTFGRIANTGFNTTAHLSALEAWAFTLFYVFQIYFDFSGYSDMAIGSALMLGIEIPRNFDAPLRSLSIIEFWTRWHISLSQFITTYLYTPLVKSMWRISLTTSAIATIIAMSIAGLWHGPAWTFVIYGLIHGVALACNQYWRKKKMPHIPAFPSWLLTFIVVIVALLFFRANSLHAAATMAASLINPSHPLMAGILVPAVRDVPMLNLLMLPFGAVIAFFGKSSDDLSRNFVPTMTNAVGTAGLFAFSCIIMAFNTTQNFLYFQF